MSRRMIAVAVGILFFVQMATAMVGTSLIQAFVDGDTDRAPLTAGVLLMMCSGLAVVGIGLLMYQVLKTVNQGLAVWYPVLRIVEFTVSAVCGVYLLTQLQVVPNHLLWVYIPTGIGGLILTYLLFVSRLVPRPIAALGLVGYASLSVGVLLDLLGVLDLNEGSGLLLLVPGGLFEAVFLPIWLIAKGFRSPSSEQELEVAGDRGHELTVHSALAAQVVCPAVSRARSAVIAAVTSTAFSSVSLRPPGANGVGTLTKCRPSGRRLLFRSRLCQRGWRCRHLLPGLRRPVQTGPRPWSTAVSRSR